MSGITYSRLTAANFNEYSLDNFIRHQIASEVWLPSDGEWILTHITPAKIWDWDLEKRRQTARTISEGVRSGGIAFGAFCDHKVVGYIYITGKFWGSKQQYTELKLYHISKPYRRMGIGRTLFSLGCQEARAIGAEKLYISANNSKESQYAYRRLGCVDAVEINPHCVECEPFDVQMEYSL